MVTVKLAAEPITVPLELRNEIVPVQEAAVPPDEVVATFTTLIRAVSVLPRPVGGKGNVRVVVELEVCASNDQTEPDARIAVRRTLRRTMFRLSWGEIKG